MKKILFLFLFLFQILALTGQDRKLKGQILDSDKQPIAYSNVLLVDAAKRGYISGSTSGDNGDFEMIVPPYDCIIRVTALGYKDYERVLTASAKIDTLIIQLEGDALLLKDVVVSATLPSIRRTADRYIVTIDNSPLLKSKTLDNLLPLTPGVFSDLEGNLSINGERGVTLIIDDKTVRLKGSQLKSYLKSINGENISSISIIPNPTAQFEAEGSGGVIQIVTKKKSINGVAGYLNSGYSSRKYSIFDESVNIAFRKNKLLIYGDYTYSHEKKSMRRFSENILETDNLQYANFETSRWKNRDHAFKTGVDYDLFKNHFIGIEYNYTKARRRDYYTPVISEIYENDVYNGKYDGSTPSRNITTNNLLNLNYLWKIDSTKQDLKLLADYSDVRDKYNENYNNIFYDSDNNTISRNDRKQISDEDIKIYSGQLNYENRFSKLSKLSAGLKYSRVVTNYDVLFQNYNFNTGNYEIDNLYTDRFKYTENTYAVFLSFMSNIQKLDYNIGLRGEYTDTKGESYTENEVNKKYNFKLFPSLFLKYKVYNDNALMFYYGRRINRPSYSSVNPYVLYLNEFSLKTGNPNLTPSYTNSFDLTYSLLGKYFFSIKTAFQDDVISSVSYEKDSLSITTLRNMNKSKYVIFNIYAPVQVTKFWNTTNNLNIGMWYFKNNGEKMNSFYLDFTTNNYFTITEKIDIQFMGRFRPKSKDFYERNETNHINLSLSLNYKIVNNLEGDIGVVDILDNSSKSVSISNYEGLRRREEYRPNGRTFSINLKYYFNIGTQIKKKDKLSSNNEEMNRIW